KNLVQISTMIQKEETSGIEKEVLSKHTDDLICILPISSSSFAPLLANASHDQAVASVNVWTDLFNDGDFYLGIGDNGQPNQQQLHESAKIFHQNTQIPMVAVHDVRYLDKQDDLAYDC